MKKIVSIFLMFVMMVTNITFAPISVGAAEVSGNGYEEISISEIADDSVSATAADVIDGVEILPEQSIGVEEPLVSADSVTTKVAFSGPMVSVGNGFTVELRNDKTVWVTGDNQFGVLGDGRDAGGYSTMPVKATIENVVYISAGYSFILAVDEDGEVWAWGLNSTSINQLGLGSVGDYIVTEPMQNTFDWGDEIVAVAAATNTDINSLNGYGHCLALTAGGYVFAWGDNDNGQCGQPITPSKGTFQTPVLVQGLSSVRKIAVGNDHSMALTERGTVYTWGANDVGQLGDIPDYDYSNGSRAVPTSCEAVSGKRILAIAAGDNHCLAVDNTGRLYSWGGDFYNVGVLTGVPPVIDVSARGNVSMALTGYGDVYTWGNNDYGQLGLNGNYSIYAPTLAVGFGTVNANIDPPSISAGWTHSAAIVGHDVWVSGSNASGQLGVGRNATSVMKGTPILGTYFQPWNDKNNTFSSAKAITLDVPVNVEIATPDAESYYEFTATEAGEYKFYSYNSVDIDPQGRLYRKDQVLIGENDNGGVSRAAVAFGTGINDFFIVESMNPGDIRYIVGGATPGSEGGSYSMVVTKNNLSPIDAVEITDGIPVNVSIFEAGQIRYFKFVPSEDRLYDFQATGSSSVFNLVDDEGELIQESVDGNIRTYLEANTTYYLNAGATGVTAKYTLMAGAVYTVHYDANGGTGELADQEKLSNSTLAINAVPTREGFTHAGWSIESDALTPDYEPGSLPAGVNKDITLYAVWQRYYTVRFNGNGGAETPYDQVFAYNVPQALTTNAFTRLGHTFAGWAESADATEVAFSDMEEVKDLAENDGAIFNLYAVWTPITFTVRFDASHADAMGTMDSQEFTYDELKALSPVGFERTGYEFDDWIQVEATRSYQNQEMVSNLSTVDKAEVILYARWVPKYMEVKFMDNEENELPIASRYVYYNATYGTLPPAPSSKIGHSFFWSLNKDGTGPVSDRSKVTEANDHYLYAQWRQTATVAYLGYKINRNYANPELFSPEFYCFTPMIDGNYRFYGTSSNMSLLMQMYEGETAMGGEISSNREDKHNFTYYLEAGKTYYLYVRRGGYSHLPQAYDITVDFASVLGISMGSPVSIDVADSVQKKYYKFRPTQDGIYALASSERLDYMTFIRTDGGSVNSIATYRPGPPFITSPDWTLYDPIAGKPVDIKETVQVPAGPYGPNTINYYVLKAYNTYYFEAGCLGDNGGSYKLTMTKDTTAPPSPTLTSDGAQVKVDSANQIKTFSFVPETDGIYTFEGTATSDLQPMLALYGSGEEPLASDADRIAHVLTAGETYYIIGGINEGAVGEYRLTWAKDTPITLTDPVNVEVVQGNQKTYYSFKPESSGYYVFSSSDRRSVGGGWINTNNSVHMSQSSGWLPAPIHITKPLCNLYDSNMGIETPKRFDTRVTGAYGSTDFNIYYYLDKDTTYYLEAGCTEDTTGAYTLTLSTEEAIPDHSTITTDGTQVKIDMANQLRSFTFSPEKTGMYSFDSSDYGTNKPMLALYNSSEEVLIGGEFGVRYMLTAGETYCIIGGFADEAVGSFYLEASLAYVPWVEGVAYEPGTIVSFLRDAKGEDILYMVLQAHTGASHWFPGSTPSLYKQLAIPLWSQPLGNVDAYNKGDQVVYNGRIWISDIDANVWAPGIAGWSIYEA